MKVVLREEESGVSEVVGTILILAMTVVLFSTIILWVSNIPTPVAQTRVDIQSSLVPQYNGGTEAGDWVNLTHMGGESLPAASTSIYISDQKGGSVPKTSVLRIAPFRSVSGSTKYGMLDGPGTSWSVGQRFSYFNSSLSVSDNITVTIVDLVRSLVIWNGQLNSPAGTRPPIILNVWASATLSTSQPTPVETGLPLYVFAQITDPDGDLNANRVFANLTACWSATAQCAQRWALQMYDNGQNGDRTPGDGVFTLSRTWLAVPDLSWDGSLVLFSAADLKGHITTTRMTLHVIQGSSSSNPGGGLPGSSGRPPNLRWNGNQGYNIFNLTEWKEKGYAARPSRNFTGSDTVVLVVGSLSLENIFSMNSFNLWDPLSQPAQAVVYLSSNPAKTVGVNSKPSSTQAFNFFQFVNGYYIYTYQFELNNASAVGTNFYIDPSFHPPFYVYGRYTVSLQLMSSTGNSFSTSDSVNITATRNAPVQFPVLQTFSDSGFSHISGSFKSTDTVYLQVTMNNVDLSVTSVYFGNVIIQDYLGDSQLFRAPLNGYQSNLPICPKIGSCASGTTAVSIGPRYYQFAINLSRVNQAPWVAGTQNYALVLSVVKDTNEYYSNVATQVAITAPLYKMDVIVGNGDTQNSAWGTHDYAYFYNNVNGVDWWSKNRLDYCAGAGNPISLSGLTGSSNTCPSPSNVQVALADFNKDGTLDVAESIYSTQGSVVAVFSRTVDSSGNIIYFPRTIDPTPPQRCSAIAAGDLTGDGIPDIACGGDGGNVWYYRNDGNWTRVSVDSSTALGTINAVAIGDFTGDGANDLAVAGRNGLVWYPNLDKIGTFNTNTVSSTNVATGQTPVLGTRVSGDLFSTAAADGVTEQIREQPINISQATNTNPNGGFDSNANWTPATILAPATATYQAAGGNLTGYGQIQTLAATNSVPAAYLREPFILTGSSPYYVTLSYDYELLTNGATGAPGVTLSVFVDAAPGIPIQSQAVSTVSVAQGVPKVWTHVDAFQNRLLSQLTGSGTYYLKVAMYTTCATTCTTTTGGFDNVHLSWSSTPGSASALEQYFDMGRLPNRLGNNSVRFYIQANHSANLEADNFVLAWSANVGADPTAGTYTSFYWVNNTVMPGGGPVAVTLTSAQVSQVLGKEVWVRVLDTNRTVGGSSLDVVYLDAIYITVTTQFGTPGYQLATDGGSVTSLDVAYLPRAGTSTQDPWADPVAGTAKGNVFVYDGSPSGPSALSRSSPPSPYFATGSAAVVGVKFGNVTGSSLGLDIVVVTSAAISNIMILPGWNPGPVSAANYTLTLASFTSFPPKALAVGDVNGDGIDDIVIVAGSNNAGSVVFVENLGGGRSWYHPVNVIDSSVGAPVFSVAIGATSNSQYLGR